MNRCEGSPFSGLRVIEVASFVAAPAAATMLSDLGATVIKVEPAGGDPWRMQHMRPGLPRSETNYLWQLTGRGKKSVVLDLKDRGAQTVLHRMVSTADLFITNMPTPVRDRLGISYEQLVGHNPRLIYASLTGYGETGALKTEKAYDTTVWWGRSGLMEQLRAGPDEAPVRPPLAMGDHTTALAFFGAITSALYRRERTGQGALVGTSLLATGTWVNGPLVQAGLAGAEIPPRPSRSTTANPLQCHYTCGDGRWIMLIVNFDSDESSWPRLARCIGLAEAAKDKRFDTYPARERNRGALITLLDKRFKELSSLEWLGLIRGAGFTVELINTPSDTAADPLLRNAGVIVPQQGGPDNHTVGCPVWFSDLAPRTYPAAPQLNQNSREALSICGFSTAEIKDLEDAGLVACAKDLTNV